MFHEKAAHPGSGCAAFSFSERLEPAALELRENCFPMEKETISNRTPPPPKVPSRTETPVRTMSMEKARKLIRKTSAEHAELFRRLAK